MLICLRRSVTITGTGKQFPYGAGEIQTTGFVNSIGYGGECQVIEGSPVPASNAQCASVQFLPPQPLDYYEPFSACRWERGPASQQQI